MEANATSYCDCFLFSEQMASDSSNQKHTFNISFLLQSYARYAKQHYFEWELGF